MLKKDPIAMALLKEYNNIMMLNQNLSEDEALAKIDKIQTKNVNHRLACRPFGENCGFTLSEGSQFIILFDDELALELGAEIYGSVADVFVNADGFKKSIPGPGVGNYLTVGKAMGLIRSILGTESLRNRSYMQAHGTSRDATSQHRRSPCWCQNGVWRLCHQARHLTNLNPKTTEEAGERT